MFRQLKGLITDEYKWHRLQNGKAAKELGKQGMTEEDSSRMCPKLQLFLRPLIWN
jgi:hypothetical protein